MNNSSEKIALGCDHAAYQLKEQVKAHLEARSEEHTSELQSQR